MLDKKFFYFFRDEEEFREYLHYYEIEDKFGYLKNESFFECKYQAITQNQLNNFDTIIVTSPKVIRALEKNNLNLDKFNILIVGSHSAKRIGKLGGKTEFIANDIDEIVKFLDEKISSFKNRKILYLRGNYITFDIKKYFEDKLHIEDFEIYNIKYKSEFSAGFLSDLLNEKISHIAFFSYKSTENFFEIFKKLELEDKLKEVKIFVMNEKSKLIADDYSKYTEISDVKLLVENIKNFLNS